VGALPRKNDIADVRASINVDASKKTKFHLRPERVAPAEMRVRRNARTDRRMRSVPEETTAKKSRSSFILHPSSFSRSTDCA
jgi:hypothetical protein